MTTERAGGRLDRSQAVPAASKRSKKKLPPQAERANLATAALLQLGSFSALSRRGRDLEKLEVLHPVGFKRSAVRYRWVRAPDLNLR